MKLFDDKDRNFFAQVRAGTLVGYSVHWNMSLLNLTRASFGRLPNRLGVVMALGCWHCAVMRRPPRRKATLGPLGKLSADSVILEVTGTVTRPRGRAGPDWEKRKDQPAIDHDLESFQQCRERVPAEMKVQKKINAAPADMPLERNSLRLFCKREATPLLSWINGNTRSSCV